MSNTTTSVEKRIQLPAEVATHLTEIAQQRQISEDQLIAYALDVLFQLIANQETADTSREWAAVSESAFQRVWDNDLDAVYDNWRELYGVPEG